MDHFAQWVLGLGLMVCGLAYAYGVYTAAQTSIPKWSADRIAGLIVGIAAALGGLFIITH